MGFVQIGTTAFRDPNTGKFGNSVPLFIREEDVNKQQEESLMQQFAHWVLTQMKETAAHAENQAQAVNVQG